MQSDNATEPYLRHEPLQGREVGRRDRVLDDLPRAQSPVNPWQRQKTIVNARRRHTQNPVGEGRTMKPSLEN